MKVTDLFEAVTKKSLKLRPKTNLWFRHKQFWHHDLNSERGDVVYHEDEEENIYATDQDNKMCYGYWNKKNNGGMTFFNPIPFSHYSHKRKMIRREI